MIRGSYLDDKRTVVLRWYIDRSATIIVRIKNQGDTAYMRDEFGDSIIIERHFSRSGTSGFKIKSSSSRIISTKKSDLDSITDYFSLQLDNPMNVLSQDLARQFIGSSSPQEKYKFFVRGVQLEQLDHDYCMLEEKIEGIESKLSTRKEDIKFHKERRDRTQSRLAMSDKQESLRQRVRKLRNQMAWAQVEEQEKVCRLYSYNLPILTIPRSGIRLMRGWSK